MVKNIETFKYIIKYILIMLNKKEKIAMEKLMDLLQKIYEINFYRKENEYYINQYTKREYISEENVFVEKETSEISYELILMDIQSEMRDIIYETQKVARDVRFGEFVKHGGFERNEARRDNKKDKELKLQAEAKKAGALEIMKKFEQNKHKLESKVRKEALELNKLTNKQILLKGMTLIEQVKLGMNPELKEVLDEFTKKGGKY